MTAAQYLQSKPAVATALSAAEIAVYVPAALREASVFSARTVYAEHVAATQADIVRALRGDSGVAGTSMSPAEIRAGMKRRLAALDYKSDPAERGSLTDLASDRRTNLIISMQESGARGYAVWRSHQDETLMTVWPAQELYRAIGRKVPRDWKARWNDARRALGEGGTSATYATSQDGPFVALKNDAIWTHPGVNRFGHPWTPFDYESGMRLRSVKASRARELGVLQGKAYPAPQRDPLRQVQSSSALGVPPGLLDAWVKPFGNRAVVSDGRVWVAPEAAGVLAEIAQAAAAGLDATGAFGFAPARVLSQAQALLGRSLPAHTALELSAAAISSGAVSAELLPQLPAFLTAPSVAKEADGALSLTTRASVARLRPDAALAVLAVESLTYNNGGAAL